MAHSPSPDRAATLALNALAWLANRPEALNRFLALSGTEAPSLRARANEPELLLAVLDFLSSDETLAAEFCETTSISSAGLHAARRTLAGE
jgi:hypothetical protein